MLLSSKKLWLRRNLFLLAILVAYLIVVSPVNAIRMPRMDDPSLIRVGSCFVSTPQAIKTQSEKFWSLNNGALIVDCPFTSPSQVSVTLGPSCVGFSNVANKRNIIIKFEDPHCLRSYSGTQTLTIYGGGFDDLGKIDIMVKWWGGEKHWGFGSRL